MDAVCFNQTKHIWNWNGYQPFHNNINTVLPNNRHKCLIPYSLNLLFYKSTLILSLKHNTNKYKQNKQLQKHCEFRIPTGVSNLHTNSFSMELFKCIAIRHGPNVNIMHSHRNVNVYKLIVEWVVNEVP